MIATLVNDWYMTTDTGGSMGTTDTSNISAYQKHNAEKVYNYFSALGWSLSAIAGMLGNMQVESWLSPALIQGTHRSQLPNSASSLSDVPNSVMINFYGASGYGVGLVQWDGYTSTAPAGQKLVSFAMRYSLNWYDGDTQLFRIRREQETNIQWQSRVINGTRWYWNNYVNNTQTPEVSARIWMVCYEVADAGTSERRQANARYWYDYFQDVPPVPPTPTPDDWIDGSTFASLALAYDPDVTGVQIPYSQMDCIGFVNTVWQDIPVVSQNGYSLTNGTNSLWRSTRTFPTESPAGQNPTPELWVKDTIGSVEINYGAIPTGALLFHRIPEDGDPPIPPQYAGDGVGNFVHVGIYCGNNEVMQSGGRDSGSIPGGGVHKSVYDPTAWNYVAFVCYVDPSGDIPPEPPEPPAYDIVTLLSLWYANKKKGVTKCVKRKL